MNVDWNHDDNVGPAYRKREPTLADYDEIIEDLKMARAALASGDEALGCVICHDGHGVAHCHHNVVVLARQFVAERNKYRCFHCGFVAMDEEQARAHFGNAETEIASCLKEMIR